MKQALPAVPAVSFEVDTFELLVLRVGTNASELDPESVKRLQAEHLEYLFHLQASGKLLAAGAIATRSEGQRITGLGFFALGSVDDVKRLSDEDPSIRAGLESAEVVVFMCPKGALSFPHAGANQPNVKQNASAPGSRNSISNRRSRIGPG